MLEIWGRKNSSNVMQVMWAVAELELGHVRHNVGGSFAGLDSDEYGKLNPNRKVPTIKDGDLILWESNVIIRYLAHRYGRGGLWPQDPSTLALADQWMEWLKTTVFPAFFPIFWGLVRTTPNERDDGKIADSIHKLHALLPILDEWLSGHRFVAGDDLTMGDLPLGTFAYRYYHVDIQRPEFPHISSWYDRLCQRPAYRHHVMIPFGSSPDEWLVLEKSGASD